MRILLALFLGTSFFAFSMTGGDRFIAQKAEWMIMLGGPLLIVALARAFRDAKLREWACSVIILASALTGVYALIQAAGWDPLFCVRLAGTQTCADGSLQGGKFAAGAFLGNPGYVGLALVPGLMLAFLPFNWLYLPGGIVIVFGLLVSQGRLAILTGLILCVFGFLDAWSTKARPHLVLFVLAVPLGLISFQWPSSTMRTLDTWGSGRMLAAMVAVKQLTENPWLGNGGRFVANYAATRDAVLDDLGRESFRAPASSQQWEAAHNDYLQAMAEWGLLRALPLILLVGWIGARSKAETGIFLAWLSILFMAHFHYPFHLPTTQALFIVLTALMFGDTMLKGIDSPRANV